MTKEEYRSLYYIVVRWDDIEWMNTFGVPNESETKNLINKLKFLGEVKDD